MSRWEPTPVPRISAMSDTDAVAFVTATTELEANDLSRLAIIRAELHRLDELTNKLLARRAAIYHAITRLGG